MPTDAQEGNETIPAHGKKKKNDKLKWYLIGGAGVVAVLVLFFVNRSNSNAATNTSSATPNGTTGLDANTLAALSQAGLLGGASLGSGGGGGVGSVGPTGDAGATGPAGPPGPTGATGGTGSTGSTGSSGGSSGGGSSSTGSGSGSGATTKSGTPNPPAKAPSTTGTTSTKTYTVKAGQSLTQIANMFGISVATLAHANVYVPGEVAGNAKVGQPLGTGAGLKTGQVLKIPNAK